MKKPEPWPDDAARPRCGRLGLGCARIGRAVREHFVRLAEAAEEALEAGRELVLKTAHLRAGAIDLDAHRNHRGLHLLDDVGKAGRTRDASAPAASHSARMRHAAPHRARRSRQRRRGSKSWCRAGTPARRASCLFAFGAEAANVIGPHSILFLPVAARRASGRTAFAWKMGSRALQRPVGAD